MSSDSSPISHIQVSQINDNPYQTRECFGPIDKLAQSVATDGILQIPVARRAGTEIQLAFGHRRLRAIDHLWTLKEAEVLEDTLGVSEIHSLLEPGAMPLRFEDLSDEQMYRQAVLENRRRSNLNPIERARAIEAGQQRIGYSAEQLANLYDRSEPWIYNQLRLTRLPRQVQQWVGQERLSIRKASAIAGGFDLKRDYPDAVEQISQHGLKPMAIARYALSTDVTSDDVRERIHELKTTLKVIRNANGEDGPDVENPKVPAGNSQTHDSSGSAAETGQKGENFGARKFPEVSYDGDADTYRLLIEHESGVSIEIEADQVEDFKRLHQEIFGDPETLAGQVYRKVIEMETESGMTVEQLVESARQARDSHN